MCHEQNSEAEATVAVVLVVNGSQVLVTDIDRALSTDTSIKRKITEEINNNPVNCAKYNHYSFDLEFWGKKSPKN